MKNTTLYVYEFDIEDFELQDIMLKKRRNYQKKK